MSEEQVTSTGSNTIITHNVALLMMIFDCLSYIAPNDKINY
jgi:hypothetical protein